MKSLAKEDCLEEIKKSKEILENNLKREIFHFSYPFGTKNDADEREFKIVEELGFKSAVTTRVSPLYKKNRFSLPRIYIDRNTKNMKLRIKLSGIYFLAYKFKEIFFKKN